jgi:hypothetical protein
VAGLAEGTLRGDEEEFVISIRAYFEQDSHNSGSKGPLLLEFATARADLRPAGERTSLARYLLEIYQDFINNSLGHSDPERNMVSESSTQRVTNDHDGEKYQRFGSR